MKERKSGRATVQSIDVWRRIVTEYSGRMLTQEGDKLIAISGLAQKIMESISFPDEGTAPYLGGLWWQDLCAHLLWNVRGILGRRSSFQHTRPAEYHAPTWSWASLNGPVEYSTGLCCRVDYEINISECHCFPVSPLNPTGSIKSSYIIVTGVLVPVQLVTTRAFFHYS